jgi:zinc transport system ATP-binding protein
MSAADSGQIIKVSGLSFNYGRNKILDEVNFDVSKGDYLGIIGPNGSGKSTLIKILLGLIKPDSGEITLFGEDISRLKDRFRLAYVPQGISGTNFDFPATVNEVIESGLTPKLGLFGRQSHKDRQTIKTIDQLTGIEKLKDKLINHLSGGERQLVFIARALVGRPEVLILDEPTTGVDIASQERFYAFLKRLNGEYGMTIIFISHDVEIITKEATHIMCLNKKLVCHTHTKHFDKEKIIKELYGDKIKTLTHSHQ